MAGEDKKNDATTGNPQGGRNSAVPSLSDTQGTVANVAGSTSEKKDENAGFGIDNGKDVKGSLKVHIKLDLQADIHITAKIKGDIAIGLL